MDKHQLIENLIEEREITLKDKVSELKTEIQKLHKILNTDTQSLKILAGIWTQVCLIEDICNCNSKSIKEHLA